MGRLKAGSGDKKGWIVRRMDGREQRVALFFQPCVWCMAMCCTGLWSSSTKQVPVQSRVPKPSHLQSPLAGADHGEPLDNQRGGPCSPKCVELCAFLFCVWGVWAAQSLCMEIPARVE